MALKDREADRVCDWQKLTLLYTKVWNEYLSFLF